MFEAYITNTALYPLMGIEVSMKGPPAGQKK